MTGLPLRRPRLGLGNFFTRELAPGLGQCGRGVLIPGGGGEQQPFAAFNAVHGHARAVYIGGAHVELGRGVALFGGEGFIMQRLVGDGIVLVHAGGTLCEKTLAPGETLKLDTGCLVALQPSVNYDIQMVGGFKNTLFGGEGLFLATLTGPGKVWLASPPTVAASAMAGRLVSFEGLQALAAAPRG